jgi:hypothetical protein
VQGSTSRTDAFHEGTTACANQVEQLVRERQLRAITGGQTLEAFSQMNFRDNLCNEVWDRLPGSKHLLGRKRVNRLIDRAVGAWPVPVFSNAENNEERLLFADAYAHRLARNEFGSVMVLLFIGLCTALVQVLLEWWLLKPGYRIDFSYWKQDLTRTQ